MELKASTTIECIVASVIWMGSFVLAVEMLTRLTLRGTDQEIALSVEIARRQCYREFITGEKMDVGQYRKEYEWGMIAVEVKPYKGEVLWAVFEVIPNNGMRRVRYNYLVLHPR